MAEDILRYALFKDVVKRQRRKKRKLNHGGAPARRGEDGEEEEEEGSDEDDENSDEEAPPERMVTPVPPAATAKAKVAGGGGGAAPRGISQDPIWGAAADSQSQRYQHQQEDVQMDLDPTHPVAASDDHSGINPERCVTLWGFIKSGSVLTSVAFFFFFPCARRFSRILSFFFIG